MTISKTKLQTLCVQIILISIGTTMLIPFAWMLATSVKPKDEVYVFPPEWIPSHFVFSNYREAWNAAPFPRFLFNSGLVATITTLSQLVTCSLAAYAFARINFWGRDTIFLLFLGTMMIPGQVTLIPTYLIMKWLGWIDTYYALIVPGLTSVSNTFLLRQFFLSFPTELEDAAKIDGCSQLGILSKIVIPNSKPALVVVGVFTFLGSWNSFVWPLIVTNRTEMKTIQIGLTWFRDQFYTIDWTQLMAGSTIAALPIIILFLIFQRHLVSGIVLSGLKF